MASYPSTCAVIGGIWRTTTTGIEACVFLSSVIGLEPRLFGPSPKSRVLYMC